MKRLTRWMVKRYLPEYAYIPFPVDGKILTNLVPGYHIHKSPAKGTKKPRKYIEPIPTSEGPTGVYE